MGGMSASALEAHDLLCCHETGEVVRYEDNPAVTTLKKNMVLAPARNRTLHIYIYIHTYVSVYYINAHIQYIYNLRVALLQGHIKACDHLSPGKMSLSKVGWLSGPHGAENRAERWDILGPERHADGMHMGKLQ